MTEVFNVTPESDPNIWATLQPPDDRATTLRDRDLFEFCSDVYFVVKRYPKPFKGNLPQIESIHSIYESASRACELENLGSDYSTYTVCIFVDGQFVDRHNRPIEYREYP